MLDVQRPIDEVVAQAREAAEAGFSSVWSSQIFGYDALTLLAAIGERVPGIELGTAVVPVQPRHPVMLAAQALTVQALTRGRLTLGIGLSHQVVIEGVFGLPFDRPAGYLSEYLEVLMPLLNGRAAGFEGERVRGRTPGPLDIPGATPPRVLLAALGRRMLGMAGRLTDGTATWMTGAKTVAEHVVPTLRRAADEAGRATPRVVVGLPVCVTDDPASAREQAARVFAIYGQLPSYRAMLDREGAAGPEDVAVIGDERDLRSALRELEAAGATDLVAAPFGRPDARARTFEALRSSA